MTANPFGSDDGHEHKSVSLKSGYNNLPLHFWILYSAVHSIYQRKNNTSHKFKICSYAHLEQKKYPAFLSVKKDVEVERRRIMMMMMMI